MVHRRPCASMLCSFQRLRGRQPLAGESPIGVDGERLFERGNRFFAPSIREQQLAEQFIQRLGRPGWPVLKWHAIYRQDGLADARYAAGMIAFVIADRAVE